jgi:hemerythrin
MRLIKKRKRREQMVIANKVPDFLPWDGVKMSVGIREIDSQHQKLVGMLNALNAEMKLGKGSEASKKILKELLVYTQTHFATEEKLMKTHAYPGSDNHRSEHIKLLSEASGLEEQILKTTAPISIKLLQFLKKWLTDHIMAEDKKFGQFLKTKGVS